ncbi:AbrB family transcriptional regulator [Paenibacillus sp.]|uniref:AbrB family transcriptional regulator n=1 Tax=Paenibacillus sp. TaxID=58172 RepID=UPI002D719CCE|nr:AbrB family transcriptional regulator [Paenibacillus sp.]HZG85653.1 AbrB family transcriptional regulator [Paenibacillus sp.]
MNFAAAGYASLLPAYAAAFLGGWAFAAMSLPLPWVLGPMAAVMLWKAYRPPARKTPAPLRNGALVALGIVFGLQFTGATIVLVGPYLLPYLGITAVTIVCCVGLGVLFSRWTATDRVSSVFGFIPGGLTEMVVTGTAVGAKPGTVVFLQTLRLLSVLSVVPLLVTLWFAPEGSGAALVSPAAPSAGPSAGAAGFAWYALPALGGWLLRRIVPASYVLVPMLLTALLHIAGAGLPAIPAAALIAAQVVVGAGLGESVSFRDLRAVSAQWWRVLLLVAAMLALSLLLGAALHAWTGMGMPAALLSVAPGGLIEMALTASSVGADAAVVTSLQMVRLYTIIGIVPIALKLWFGRGARADRLAE